MKYVGSKNRYAKHILPLILKHRTDNFYVEPFAGGFNCIDKVQGKRIASDIHTELIDLFKGLQKGFIIPDKITETMYYDIKYNPHNYEPALVGFVGFCCSFGGKWWGGYARGTDIRGNSRNYAAEAKRNLEKQRPFIRHIDIYNKSYLELEIPPKSIIYCDPPYKNTIKFQHEIDHCQFFEWGREKAKEGHQIFISEYEAPDDFTLLWSKQVNNTLDLNTGNKQGTEKLFTINI